MQEKEKINVSGKMKSLGIGESFVLDRSDYIVSSVRGTATIIRQDTGSQFSVSVSDSEIRVERVK